MNAQARHILLMWKTHGEIKKKKLKKGIFRHCEDAGVRNGTLNVCVVIISTCRSFLTRVRQYIPLLFQFLHVALYLS